MGARVRHRAARCSVAGKESNVHLIASLFLMYTSLVYIVSMYYGQSPLGENLKRKTNPSPDPRARGARQTRAVSNAILQSLLPLPAITPEGWGGCDPLTGCPFFC
jgi:hypothetical protein